MVPKSNMMSRTMYQGDKNSKNQIWANVPNQDTDMGAELARADETIATLRREVRGVCVKYRLWRAALRCGRDARDDGFVAHNMVLIKKIRGLWGTMRFAQMVRADILQAMEMEAANKARLDEIESAAQYGYKPELISYDELEARFGPAVAQDLFDDMLSQTAKAVKAKRVVS